MDRETGVRVWEHRPGRQPTPLPDGQRRGRGHPGYRADSETRGTAAPPCPDHEDILVFTPDELEILEQAVAMLKAAAT